MFLCVSAARVPFLCTSASHAHPAKLERQSKYHPYDALWAQLTDLHGSLGTPAHMAHTLVLGKNTSLVCPLLYVLTYFIRCNEVCGCSLLMRPLCGTSVSLLCS